MSISRLDEFFCYNLPIQVSPDGKGGTRVLLYQPRKERITAWLSLEGCDGVLPEDATREQFFNRAAEAYENLAKLMRHAAAEPKALIYYPDGRPTLDTHTATLREDY